MNIDILMLQQEIVEMLCTMVEEKDIYTAGHSKRVAMYSVKLAQAIGLSEDEQNTVYAVGLLHDVGKMLTPESILLKPRKFNRFEHEIIKQHSIDGERMVGAIRAFAPYAKIIRHHHERFDGFGYPDGLKGEEIPFLSRIIAVADAFDAMTTHRIHKVRKTISEALGEITKHAGLQFDPSVVDVAKSVFLELKELVQIAQTPQSYSMYEERFAYYFKDPLTGVYSADYLNYFLQNNRETKYFQCCYMIQLHHMQAYNECYGWQSGDKALKEVALRLKTLFKTGYVFRIFGDDFLVLNKEHFEVDLEATLHRVSVGLDPIEADATHFDLSEESVEAWDSLEERLNHYDY